MLSDLKYLELLNKLKIILNNELEDISKDRDNFLSNTTIMLRNNEALYTELRTVKKDIFDKNVILEYELKHKAELELQLKLKNNKIEELKEELSNLMIKPTQNSSLINKLNQTKLEKEKLNTYLRKLYEERPQLQLKQLSNEVKRRKEELKKNLVKLRSRLKKIESEF